MKVYISLGSNLDNPMQHIKRALRQLMKIPNSRMLEYSRCYLNPALDFPHQPSQPDYINAVALVETRLKPQILMNYLFKIEQQHHRVRQRRWGARTLDLDLLLYGNLRLKRPKLIIPHPRIQVRAFIIYPLNDLNHNLIIPGRGRLSRIINRINSHNLQPQPYWKTTVSRAIHF